MLGTFRADDLANRCSVSIITLPVRRRVKEILLFALENPLCSLTLLAGPEIENLVILKLEIVYS